MIKTTPPSAYPPIEVLRARYSYNPETGVVTRLLRKGYRSAHNAIVGHINPRHGYWRTTIDKKSVHVHRLAWALHYGAWPDGFIDHINNDRADNRLSNLRVASLVANAQNLNAPMSHSSTGLLGVAVQSKSGKFIAQIRANGKRFWLGTFDEPIQAHAAYLKAKGELHPGWVPRG